MAFQGLKGGMTLLNLTNRGKNKLQNMYKQYIPHSWPPSIFFLAMPVFKRISIKLYCSAEYSRLQHVSPLIKTAIVCLHSNQDMRLDHMQQCRAACVDIYIHAEAQRLKRFITCSFSSHLKQILKTEPVQNRIQFHRIRYSEMDIPNGNLHKQL